MRQLTILAALSVAIGCSADNILVFLPNGIRSHYLQVEPIFRALALRGYNVTEVSPYPPKEETLNLRHIFFAETSLPGWSNSENLVEYSDSRKWSDHLTNFKRSDNAEKLASEVLSSSVFHDLTHGDNQFDLIFTELFFHQESLVVLGHIFNAPIVTYSSNGYGTEILRHSGAQNAVAYLPERMNSYYSGPMSLLERLMNAWEFYTTALAREYWYYPKYDAVLSQHISGPLPRISDMLRNVSIFFLTANFAIDGSKLYPPNVVEISGLHIQDPKPLDEELQKIMDSSNRGVIFFSLGSLLKMSNFKTEDIKIFLKVFKELDQTVLWKSNLNFSDLDIPKNVHMRDWFDQKSILAHPNCVLFVTHGGLSSIMEAVRYAVPVVGMPFFADQDINIANAVYYGYGLSVVHKDLTDTSLRWAINTVLGEPRFKENIRKASEIFMDRPLPPVDTAIYWIEYVIKHKGAHHLKPPTVQMSWYQIFLLDVIAIYLLASLTLMFLITILVIFLGRKCVDKARKIQEKIN